MEKHGTTDGDYWRKIEHGVLPRYDDGKVVLLWRQERLIKDVKGNVLIIGPWYGIFGLRLLQEGFYNLDMIDIEEYGKAMFNILYAKLFRDGATPQARYIVDDVFKHDFGDKKYDTIIACQVLEHIKELDKLLDIIYDLLNDGGVFLGDVPLEGSYACADHVNYFTTQGLYDLLSAKFAGKVYVGKSASMYGKHEGASVITFKTKVGYKLGGQK